MFAEYLAGTNLMIWPLVALAIFFAVFVGVLVQVTFGMRKSRTVDRLATLPLSDDDGCETSEETRDA